MLRNATRIVRGTTMTTRALAVLILGFLGFQAVRAALSSTHLYDWGFYGAYPQRAFKSFDLLEPSVNFVKWDERCDDGGYYLISPNGKYVTYPGPVILDSRGNLVWTSDRYEHVSNLNIQTYKGRRYLTFWSSHIGVIDGYGRGVYYMLDENYEVFRKLAPKGDHLWGDMHEFKLTDEGTALMTVYNPIPGDLTPIGGTTDGWILDGMFQEIDLETGELLFEWKASDHLEIDDTIRWYSGKDNGWRPTDAFDFFHINSLDKDRDGNYIVSGRHPHNILCVRKDGSIKWTLGGKKNSFRDLSDGAATNFAYQHHVRIDANDTMTIFDNQAAERWGPSTPYPYSRGLLVQLNQEHLTAELIREYWNPAGAYLAVSQGSAQRLDSGNMLLGYGQKPTWTEFAADGEVLCEVRLSPWITFPFGWTGSYRTVKQPWIGKPLRRPNIYLGEGTSKLFASWNGATEVASWVLQGASFQNAADGPWEDLATLEKSEFEAMFQLNGTMPPYLRVTALDRAGQPLSHTETVSRKWGNSPSKWLDNIISAVTWGCVLLGSLVVSLVLWRFGVFRMLRQKWASGAIRLEPANRMRNWRYCFRLPHEGLYVPRWTVEGTRSELEPLNDHDD